MALFSVLTAIFVFTLIEWGLMLVAMIYVSATHADEEAEEGLVVRAFGDSYTFGIGADRPGQEGYPEVAGRLLEERIGSPVVVRNHARPGLNSTRIVRELDRVLTDGAADVVLILAGVNNTRWLGQSGRFCLDEGAPPPPGPVQDLRLYRVMRHALLAGRPPRPADVACAAVAQGFQFLDDGRPDLAEAEFEAARRAWPATRWAWVGSGLAAARIGDHELAVSRFEGAADLVATSPALPLAYAFALRSAGRASDARDALSGVPRDGDLAEAVALLEGLLLHDEGRHDEAERALLAVARGEPGRPAGGGVVPFAMNGVGWSRMARGDADGARAAFLAANGAGDPIHITPHLLGWAHLGLAALDLAAGVPTDSVGPALDIARRDSTTVGAAARIEDWAAGGVAPTAEAIARQIRSTPTPAVQQWFDPGDTSLLVSDLRYAVERARERGAMVVLLTYPQPAAHDEIAEAVVALGRELDVSVVDPRDRFASEHDAGRPWSELLIPDGHPTSAGYALIGAQVADAIRSRGRERGRAGW